MNKAIVDSTFLAPGLLKWLSACYRAHLFDVIKPNLTRSFRLIFLVLFMGFGSAFGQSGTPAKIYFYSVRGSLKLKTEYNFDKPILISRYTFLETNLDSIGISVLSDKKVFIHFNPGQSCFYRIMGNNTNSPMVTACPEQDFWLSVYFAGAGTYRHYFLDKNSGLRLVEEK